MGISAVTSISTFEPDMMGLTSSSSAANAGFAIETANRHNVPTGPRTILFMQQPPSSQFDTIDYNATSNIFYSADLSNTYFRSNPRNSSSEKSREFRSLVAASSRERTSRNPGLDVSISASNSIN